MIDTMSNPKVVVPQMLKKLRKSLRLTQEEVAEEIGMGWRGYQKYETGERFPPTETISKLADLYGVRIATILEGAEVQPSPKKATAPSSEEIADAVAKKLGSAKKEITPEQEEALKNYDRLLRVFGKEGIQALLGALPMDVPILVGFLNTKLTPEEQARIFQSAIEEARAKKNAKVPAPLKKARE